MPSLLAVFRRSRLQPSLRSSSFFRSEAYVAASEEAWRSGSFVDASVRSTISAT